MSLSCTLRMCLIIFEEKAELQDQYPLSLNLVHKAENPIQDRNRNIGPRTEHFVSKFSEFYGTLGRWKWVYFSILKFFGLIILKQSVHTENIYKSTKLKTYKDRYKIKQMDFLSVRTSKPA